MFKPKPDKLTGLLRNGAAAFNDWRFTFRECDLDGALTGPAAR